MNYKGIKEVRKHNGQQFIDDFKRLYSFVVFTKYSHFFEIKKSEIWDRAKTHEVMYGLRQGLYQRDRTSMVII